MAYEKEKSLHKYSEYNGKATNNYAEYKAVLLALKWCSSNTDPHETTIELFSDNELVVRQLNGAYKIKSKLLIPINAEIRKLISMFRKVEFKNVRRENIYISAVDRSLNVLLDERLKSEDSKKI